VFLIFTPGAFCQAPPSRSGSGNGKALSSTLLITLKMAVLAPIPNASVTIVARGKRGGRAGRGNLCFKPRFLPGKGYSRRNPGELIFPSRSLVFVINSSWV